jgi:hypothetical protein
LTVQNSALAHRIAAAKPHEIAIADVLAFLQHYDSVRQSFHFVRANERVIDRVMALAAIGHERIIRLGTTNDRIFVRTDGGIRAIDPRTREIVELPQNTTNALFGRSLREHVRQHREGSQFFSAYPTGRDDLVFLIKDAQVTVRAGTPSPEAVGKLAEMLIAGSEPGGDVIFTMQPQFSDAQRERLRDIAFSLAEPIRAAGGRRLCFDDLGDETRARAAALRHSKPDASIVALVADESFKVEDAKVIQNIEEELEGGGIRVVHVGKTGDVAVPSESVAMVITGHSATELREFVQRLVDQGALRGKAVILNSCGTSLTADLASTMVRDGGATGVFHFRGVITATQVRRFMRATVNARSSTDPASGLTKVFEDSSAQSGLTGLWQISRSDRKAGRGLAGGIDVG